MYSLTVGLVVKSTEPIMTTEKPITKNNKKGLGCMVDPNNTAADKVDCDLQTIQGIDFLARAVQDLSNRGLLEDVTLLQAIDTNYANLYKAFQGLRTQTKTKSSDSWVIDLLALKSDTMSKSTQFRDWLSIMESTLDEATSFDGFNPFSDVVRETEDHKNHSYLSLGITFSGWCKAVARIYGKHFDEDIRRFSTSLRVGFVSCGLSYCDENEKKNMCMPIGRTKYSITIYPLIMKKILIISRRRSSTHPILKRRQL